MVGLALEVHETAKHRKQLKESNIDNKKQDADNDLKQIELSLENQGVSPNFADVIHYAFCYIGVLTGNSNLYLGSFLSEAKIETNFFRSILQV